jgi:RES domain-containing protein
VAALFRICRSGFRPQDAAGAALFPGRWNKFGQGVLYFSSSLSLSVLELRANGIAFQVIRSLYVYSVVMLESAPPLLEAVPEDFYGSGWAERKSASREYGGEWAKARRSLLLEVKSAVLPTEANFILNTSHPEFARVRFSDPHPVPLDTRL